LVFLIYINDVPELCAAKDPVSEIFLYANDSKIHMLFATRVIIKNYSQ